jgi:hypothetical protein
MVVTLHYVNVKFRFSLSEIGVKNKVLMRSFVPKKDKIRRKYPDMIMNQRHLHNLFSQDPP